MVLKKFVRLPAKHASIITCNWHKVQNQRLLNHLTWNLVYLYNTKHHNTSFFTFCVNCNFTVTTKTSFIVSSHQAVLLFSPAYWFASRSVCDLLWLLQRIKKPKATEICCLHAKTNSKDWRATQLGSSSYVKCAYSEPQSKYNKLIKVFTRYACKSLALVILCFVKAFSVLGERELGFYNIY